MDTPHILVVDDEKEICDLIEIYLSQEGYIVHKRYDATNILNDIRDYDIELVILDVMMPEIDGMQALELIRSKYNIPVIFLSAKTSEDDKVEGLMKGADDYICKPFNAKELVARVKAHISRYQRLVGDSLMDNEIVEIRGLKIDKTSRRVFVDGEEKNFTTKEFELLTFLAEHPNRVYSKEELFAHIWNMESVGDIATVTVHIKKIREKIERNSSKPQYIETMWGVGYRFKI